MGTLARVYQNVVFLHISCEFVVLNTLLKFDESLVKFRVELAALFKHILKIVLGDYSLVQYLKEHHSFWILRLLADKRSERTHVLLNRLSQLLTLCLEFIISSEVLHVFLSVLIKDSLLIGLFVIHLHKILNRIEVVVKGDSGSHYLIFLFGNHIKLVKAIFNSDNCRVSTEVLALLLLWYLSCNFLSCLA